LTTKLGRTRIFTLTKDPVSALFRANHRRPRSARLLNRRVHMGALVATEHTSDASVEASSGFPCRNGPTKLDRRGLKPPASPSPLDNSMVSRAPFLWAVCAFDCHRPRWPSPNGAVAAIRTSAGFRLEWKRLRPGLPEAP